jgi:hypothetical protein
MATAHVQVVRALYSVPYVAFCIPKGLNLDDETQVTDYHVKWNVLHIYLVNGDHIDVEPSFNEMEEDSEFFKRPTKMEIGVALDWEIPDEEDK